MPEDTFTVPQRRTCFF